MNVKSTSPHIGNRTLVITPCATSGNSLGTAGAVVARLQQRGDTVTKVNLDDAALVLFSDPHFTEIFMVTDNITEKHRQIVNLLDKQNRCDKFIFVHHGPMDSTPTIELTIK